MAVDFSLSDLLFAAARTTTRLEGNIDNNWSNPKNTTH